MTTTVTQEAAGGARPPQGPTTGRRETAGDARGAWTNAWRVALRMARRDARRHKGRSALVLLMVGLPTALLVFAVTVAATGRISGAESVPLIMGDGVAAISPPSQQRLAQPFDGGGTIESAKAARPIPGYRPDRPAYDNEKAIGRLLGGTAVAYEEVSGSVVVGDSRIELRGIAVDPAKATGLLTLTSGRWPRTEREIVVGDVARSRGVADHGPLEVRSSGEARAFTVVGTFSSTTQWGEARGFAVLRRWTPFQGESGWVIHRTSPVAWPEVRTLNHYGLTVVSREVLTDPPPLSELDPAMSEAETTAADDTNRVVALGGALLLVVTSLLVGPAFAVSAARQRRTLALAASNGATVSQLRKTVLAAALVLGALAAVAATGVGIVTAYALWRLARGWGWPDYFAGPFDVPVGQVAFVLVTAVVSALVAALVPAQRLGRLDIVGVMKGQSVSPRPNRVVFGLGVVVAGLGGLGIIAGVLDRRNESSIVVSAVALILGTLCLVPVLLTLVGRLGTRLPVPLRMASRDLARQRTRSAPTVAAVLAAVASLTVGMIGLTSDSEQRSRGYVPQTLPGEMTYTLDTGGASYPTRAQLEEVGQALRRVRPDLVVMPLAMLVVEDPQPEASAPTRVTYPWVNLVPPGCTAAQTVVDPVGEAQTGSGPNGSEPRCQKVGSTAMADGASPTVLPADEIVRRLGLEGTAADKVRAGGIVTAIPGALTDGRARVAWGTKTSWINTDGPAPTSEPSDPSATGPGHVEPVPTVKVVGLETVPAVVVPRDLRTTAAMFDSTLMIPAELAGRHAWKVEYWQGIAHDPAGAIDARTQERLAAAVGDGDVYVERGYQRGDQTVVVMLVGVLSLLLLVVVLTSTALTLAEQQQDQATLAAMGATRGTRRLMAAGQAFATAVVGVALGLGVGAVPGVAVAMALTRQGFDPVTGQQVDGTVVAIPWLPLAVVAVGVPVLAAIIAGLGVRRAPDATGRTSA